MRVLAHLATTCLLCSLILASRVHAQATQARILQRIDNNRIVRLPGNHSPLARPEFELGAADSNTPMNRMVLFLRPDATQTLDLEALLRAQHDPGSPLYHQWLTPQQFGAQFGLDSHDLATIREWLANSGFTVEPTPAGQQYLVFSGSVGQVEAAFHTAIRLFLVTGQIHQGNIDDPAVPQALAPVVNGVVTLHDFRRHAQHTSRVAPDYSSGSYHYLAPADFATIYDVSPLYTNGTSGSGESIAIAGRTNIAVSDVHSFRSTMGLPTNDPTVIVNGSDPGVVSSDEETEADLDVEWSGAAAPNAAVQFVVSASTDTTDGIDLSSSYIVDHNLAPVMSVSFGSCEADMGRTELSFYNSLWQQAGSQGISVFVSAGDSGAAGCDSSTESYAQGGRAVNGLCSTPYNVCVGGTEFEEGSNAARYWSNRNSSNDGSALSYIPEVAWNESGSNGGSDLAATGGGASTVYAKPSWQAGTGVTADGKRDVPDVALSAAGHDAYLIYQNGSLGAVGGTSASSPSFAGLMALVDQKNGGRQGNANPKLYPLFSQQGAGGPAVFHATVGGNNTVPGVQGYSAASNYNQATGLGSVDTATLVNNWNQNGSASFTLTASATQLALHEGANASLTLTTQVSGGFDSAITFTIAGTPSGATASFSSAVLSAPGSGSTTLTIYAGEAAPGVYTLTVSAQGDQVTRTAAITLTVSAAPGCTLQTSPSSLSISPGSSGGTRVSCTAAQGGFSSQLALTASGLPAGATATFTPSSIAPNSGQSTISIAVPANVANGTYNVTVSANGGAITETTHLTLTVSTAAVITISASAANLTLVRGSNISVTLHASSDSGAAITFSTSNIPPGIAASFSPVVAGPSGTESTTLTLAAGAQTIPGRYLLLVTGSSNAGAGRSAAINLRVTGVATPGSH